MLLTEPPNTNGTMNLAPKNTWSKSSEEVRKSLDVLDKVLSEFDDIDDLSENEEILHIPLEDYNTLPDITTVSDVDSAEGSVVANVDSTPPPIDRTLKPKNAAPTLPKKVRKSQSLPVFFQDVPGQLHDSEHQESKQSGSDASSHEYQEINTDLLGSNRRRSPLTRCSEEKKTSDRKEPDPSYSIGKDSNTRKNCTVESRGRSGVCPTRGQLRKSKSGDIPSLEDNKGRGRRYERRSMQRRSSSSDRVFDNPRTSFYSMPHSRFEANLHPQMINTLPIDPMFMEPRVLDPTFFDTRLGDHRIPFDVQRPIMMNPRLLPNPRFDLEDNLYPIGTIPHFPHLMNDEIPSHSLPPRGLNLISPSFDLDLPAHPFEYPLLQPPFAPPEFVDINLPAPFHPPMDFVDPTMYPLGLPHYPSHYPYDLGVSHPSNNQMEYFPPDMMGYPDARNFPNNCNRRMRHEPIFDRGWLPPGEAEVARTMNQQIMRNQSLHHGGEDGRYRGESDRMSRMRNKNLHARRAVSTGPSDNSRRSNNTSIQQIRSYNFGSNSGPTSFKVGEAVRDGNDGVNQMDKSTVSLPHQFASCGKDSGFDESPIIEASSNTNSTGGKSPHLHVGGFIVSGVFNDSSKIYIPAPPSPTPDYDEDALNSDGSESDIIHGTMYTVPHEHSEKDGNKEKMCLSGKVKINHSNRSSVSDDSLQDTGELPARRSPQSQTLQAMINEFHRGLPLSRVDGSYSDDSLEESSVIQSRPSTIGLKNRKLLSMESLISMDGSTTSFDYLSGGNNKSLTPKNQKLRKKGSLQDTQQNNQKLTRNSNNITHGHFSQNTELTDTVIKSNQTHQDDSDSHNVETPTNKFDTIRHLIKEGLIEGLDEQPPSFKPPPVITNDLSYLESEERPDSGINSGASTGRTNESGGSDSLSEKSAHPSSKDVICSATSFSINSSVLNSIANKQQKDGLDAIEYSPSILSPFVPHVPSVCANNQDLPRNNSWLHKKKRQAPIPNQSTGTSSNSNNVKNTKKDKITHVDDINTPLNSEDRTSKLGSKNSGSAPQYTTAYDQRNEISRDLTRSVNNLVPSHNGPDPLSVICEDRSSISSQGSRSGQLCRRYTDSMKYGPTSHSTGPNNNSKLTKMQISSPKGFKKINGHFIKEPNMRSSKTAPLPPEIPNLINPSNIPFSIDGSGRFRSTQDLTEVRSRSRSYTNPTDDISFHSSKKRNDILSSLQPIASAEDEVKEFRKTALLICGKKKKDADSKFKFRLFNGFWRKNKYSFEKS